jgi:hypothetical protein
MIALGASNPAGGFLSATIPFLELSVLPGKEMTVLVGDKAGGEEPAFLGGRPSLDGPGPSELRNDGVGAVWSDQFPSSQVKTYRKPGKILSF